MINKVVDFGGTPTTQVKSLYVYLMCAWQSKKLCTWVRHGADAAGQRRESLFQVHIAGFPSSEVWMINKLLTFGERRPDR